MTRIYADFPLVELTELRFCQFLEKRGEIRVNPRHPSNPRCYYSYERAGKIRV